MQREASIEDQVRICTERAEREGWTVIENFTDFGKSGSTMLRAGMQQMIAHAHAGEFDIVLAESIDRLSRDQEDIAGLYKRLVFRGIRIVTLAEGEVNELHIGLKGTMGALYLKDQADKTRRGLRGRAEAGKSAGGITYGYDVVKALDAMGEPIRGERSINAEQAKVVERIFRDYLAGVSPKAIAKRLNMEGVPSPSGRGWTQSTINGNRQRGTGILNNELYVGRQVWNRLRYIKDPDTGKRISKLNPESELVIHEVPELRIIDQDLWDAVREKQTKLIKPQKKLHEYNRPRNLFSGLLKCGECGGGFSMISATHLGCSSARNKGMCENRTTISREKLEEAILGALRHKLMDPELCRIFCEEYVREINRLRAEHNAALDGYKAEYDRATQELDKLIDMVLAGTELARVKDRMHELEDRRTELTELIEKTPEAPVRLHPNMSDRYREEIGRLIAALNDPDHRTEAATVVRDLVDRIVLTRSEDGSRLVVDLIGDLAGILDLAHKEDKAQVVGRKEERSPVGGDLVNQQEGLVAGRGFEPLTFRL
nr:recombinase family protein [Roseospira goensis]